MRTHNHYRNIVAGLALTLPMSASHAQVVIDKLWVRAMPPTQTMTAAYGSVTNHGNEAIIIEGVNASFAGKATLHSSVSDGESVRMAAMGSVTLAPHESLVLTPGGNHIMLMDVGRMPSANSSVQICFDTSAQPVCAMAKVLRDAPASQHDDHQHHMNH